MSTPHNSAEVGEIAQTVIMPGDPLRAKKMAKKFLKKCKLVSSVRNNFCFTGLYKGKKVSIMSSGMGCASMGIYANELFSMYGVENAIRVGTIGSLDYNCKIGDLLVAKSSFTDTNYNQIFAKKGETEIKCSPKLLKLAEELSQKTDIKCEECSVFTTDTFYTTAQRNKHIMSLGVKGVEMECASLYDTAKKNKKNALCICTVSDEILTQKVSTSEERENNYDKMFVLALEIALKL